ncbi:MAG: SRPBCC family protein, partial [Deltaproteobacteria bacterium]|nr:SRPBCC family protein [Deltaproteobacteria bacterium]
MAGVIHREQLLGVDVDEAWRFFSDPTNLARITPPDMRFRIVSGAETGDIVDGQIIEYRLRPLLHLPARWVTRIEEVRPPERFVDVQIAGPYRLWRHRHDFLERPGGVLMIDHVDYAAPLGPLGRLLDRLVIRR